jgi:dihydroorotase/N-acyl-D-amino-acid deacylase
MTITWMAKLKLNRAAKYLALSILMVAAGLFGVRYLAEEPGYDLLIIDGRILDGSGSPWFEGSVAIKDGRVAAIGRLPNATAGRVIDARGLTVAPGFIDLHSHSDFTLLVDGKAESKIRQGVTTEILGESDSAGPILGPAVPEFDKEMAPYGLTRDWTTLGEYFARVQRQGTSVNIASYVGSGQVRMDVMGNVDRPPTGDEMAKMKDLVDQAMREGALGLASGLIYPPNSFATTDELIELAKVAARYGGIYTSHIRGEGNHWKQAIDEAIEISEKAHLPVHVLHLKIDGQANWGKMAQQVSEIQAAREPIPLHRFDDGARNVHPAQVSRGHFGASGRETEEPQSAHGNPPGHR